MRTAIAQEDEPTAPNVIKRFCQAANYISLVKVFIKPDKVTKYMNGFAVDRLFLNINMPSVSGLYFKKELGW